jgi:hypothetical protein
MSLVRRDPGRVDVSLENESIGADHGSVTCRGKQALFMRVLRFVVSALLVAVPARAFAQPDAAPSSLPPLPAPPDEPPPVAPPAPAPAAPPPTPAPPANSPSPPSAPAEEEPATTTRVTTLADMPKLLIVSVGLGESALDSRDSPTSAGVYGGAEFVLVPSMWFSPRLYGGVLFTSTDASTCPTPACDVSAKIGFLGVKGRLTIPIPYVAPFFELGIGMSVGTLTTRVYDTNVDFTGVTYHVPFAIGLSFGNKHDYVVDLAFSYLEHPAQSQLNGAIALSLAFGLK